MDIHFCFLKSISLINRTKLKAFLVKLSEEEKTKLGSLTIVFCSNQYLLDINKRFLKHDYYTDIITFDLTSKGNKEKTAEIYISTDQIRKNAVDFNTTIGNELHRVIFHGVLHLCGYNDKSRRQKEKMTEKENKYLAQYSNHK
jgi:rRNA maturation RNase YbeY